MDKVSLLDLILACFFNIQFKRKGALLRCLVRQLLRETINIEREKLLSPVIPCSVIA